MLKGAAPGLPYIKVKYKKDDPMTGRKKGEVHPLAFHAFENVPKHLQDITELEEGAADARELKLLQIEHLQQQIDTKQLQLEALKAELGEGEEGQSRTKKQRKR